MAQILVIEDNNTMREGILQVLEIMGHEVVGASDGKEGLDAFASTLPDLVITDLKMEELDGMQVLREIKEQAPDTLVVMITAFGTIELAVEAMQLGAFDFITKPFPPDLLRIKVQKALDVARTREENTYLRTEQMKKTTSLMVGSSEAIQYMESQIQKAAPTDASILITGESGTGKDTLARVIHQHSYRQKKPFIKLDCSAVTQNEIEDELFGRERGAQDGQDRKKGRLELADQGTLFLDEVTDLPDALQSKLLRYLNERSFERRGGHRSHYADVRLICATGPNIHVLVEQGAFRKDLYYKLNVVPIELAPLRDRRKDLPDLIEFFLQKQRKKFNKHFTLSQECLLLLTQYTWPGNIRELQNVISRMCILADDETITHDQLPQEITSKASQTTSAPAAKPLEQQLQLLEKGILQDTLSWSQGNHQKAAFRLGISEDQLKNKLERHGLS